MMRFPITELLAEEECYAYLLRVLHPDGLCCPQGHPLPLPQAPHDRQRAPVYDYRCRECGAVFKLFSEPIGKGTRYSWRPLVLVLRGFAQGTPTLHLAAELHVDYGTLLHQRHDFQEHAWAHRDQSSLPDALTEAAGLFQNAGEQGTPHSQPTDPPRRRANNRRGRGTMDTDRPPILGVVGRESGQIRVTVCANTPPVTLQPQVEADTVPETLLNTDDCSAYYHIPETGRGHVTVCHSRREFARDDDGDGCCEVHCTTMEGIWTGLRNFLRPFRGVHTRYLKYYVAMFEGAHNLKVVCDEFLRTAMMPSFTWKPI
jgi:transposase